MNTVPYRSRSDPKASMPIKSTPKVTMKFSKASTRTHGKKNIKFMKKVGNSAIRNSARLTGAVAGMTAGNAVGGPIGGMVGADAGQNLGKIIGNKIVGFKKRK